MVNLINISKITKIPSYITEVYGNLYQKGKLADFLDNDRVLAFLTLGARKKLVQDVVQEVAPNSAVLQIGCTFGSEIEAVADKITPYGQFDVFDVCPEQIKRCRHKTIYQKINYEVFDGRRALSQKYDTIILFMLLHEVPPASKGKILNNALDNVVTGGKVVIIDYAMPSKFNPLWYFIRAFNRLYQPFAEDMWKRSVQSYALNPKDFNWRRTFYRGGMYQKVVATRKTAEHKHD